MTAPWPGASDASRFLAILSAPGDVHELRAPKLPPRRITAAGYFSDHTRLIVAAAKLEAEHAPGVYVTLNPVRGELLARAAERVKYGIDSTSSDKDVVARRWLLVDLDPIRAAGISSSNEEHALAIQKAAEVRAALLSEGWPQPVMIDSGNGAHLLYRVDLPADDSGLVKRVLAALAHRFGDARVDVDEEVFNPARITKLPGTIARKGDSIDARPHRRSRLLDIPDNVAVVTAETLEKIAATAPAAPTPAPSPRAAAGPGAASPMDRARAYLAKVTPAVSGEAGDKATYAAACKMGDFALSESDAFTLLSEWNSACLPPWSDIDLRKKIASAYKNRKKPLGNLLNEEGPNAGKKKRTRGGGGLRPGQILEPVGAGTTATDRPKIVISTQVHEIVDAAELALGTSAAVELYQRGGQLVRIIRPSDGSPAISVAPRDHVFELLTRAARWVRLAPPAQAGGPPVEQPSLPPEWVGRSLVHRGEWSFRRLEGVIQAPTLRRDGSILSKPGYDEASGLLYEPECEFPAIPEAPTREDAIAAIATLFDVIDQFPYVKAADGSDSATDSTAALAALLTPLVRHAIEGPCPLFAIRSTTPGSGKSKLVNVAALLATGHSARVMTQKRDSDEDYKTILSLAMEGTRIVLIDNVQAPLGSEALDAALTGQTFQGRILGQSRTASPPLDMVWYATGNNMQVRGDLARRCIPIDMDPECERPEQRGNWKYPDLLAHVLRNRAALVVAGLTILRAYTHAGSPAQNLPAFGSFEKWSALVRSALVWAGCGDPCEGCTRLRKDADPELEAWEIFLEAWQRHAGPVPMTVVELLSRSKQIEDFRAALVAVDAKADADRIDARRLGYVFRKWKNRIVAGRKLVQESEDRDGAKRWCVATVGK